MQKILFNLALIETIKLCKKLDIDCSGSYLIKIPRQYEYTLCRNKGNKPIVTVHFHKTIPPSFIIHY